MEKPQTTDRTTQSTMGLVVESSTGDNFTAVDSQAEWFDQTSGDPRLEAANAPYYEALTMDDIRNRNQALAEAALRSASVVNV